MRKSTFMFSSWLTLSAVMLQSQAIFAADAPANLRADVTKGQTIYNEGKGDATACGGCHGEKALGMDAMGAPRLANIGLAYIVKQLTDFAADRRTPDGAGSAMNGFAKALTEQDRRDGAASPQIGRSRISGISRREQRCSICRTNRSRSLRKGASK